MADCPSETLFSLELLVDYLRIKSSKGDGNSQTGSSLQILPAVAFRLLDFPTVLVYRVESERTLSTQLTLKRNEYDEGSSSPRESLNNAGRFYFGKGKSCLFKMNLRSVRNLLSCTPLYAMVLDVYPEIPKLVGSCLISLASTIDEVWQDVKENGMSVPSAHGKRGIYTLCNLMGNSVGWISFGYRLSYLGTSLLPHFLETKVSHTELQLSTSTASLSKSATCDVRDKKVSDIKSSEEHNQGLSEGIPARQERLARAVSNVSVSKENSICTESEVVVTTDETVHTIIMQSGKEKKRSNSVSVSENMHTVKTSVDDGVVNVAKSVSKDEILGANVYCPPPLYYSQSVTEPNKSDNQHCRISRVADSPLTDDPECVKKRNVKKGRNHDQTTYKAEGIPTSVPSKKAEPAPRNDGVTLQQLPLLNALLVELSLLNTQSSQTAGVVPPQLPLLCKAVEITSANAPEVTKPEIVKEGCKSDTTVQGQGSFSPKFRKPNSTRVLHSHVKKQSQKENKQAMKYKYKHNQNGSSEGGSTKKKLYCGMTNTLRLRLQQTNPGMLIVHEHREQCRKKQAEALKEKNAKWLQLKNKCLQRSPAHQLKLSRGHGGGGLLHHNNSIDENVETLIQTSMEKDVLSPLNNQTSFFPESTVLQTRGNASKGAHETNSKWATEKTICLSTTEGVGTKILDSRTKIIYDQKDKGSSACLPNVSEASSGQSENETGSGMNALQIKTVNPGFPKSSVEGDDFNVGSNQRSSPENRYMDESIKSIEFTQYSEDFTSPELTGRYSEVFDSPEHVLTSPKSNNSDSIRSESDLSKYSDVSKESISKNAPLPVLSAASPVQSLSSIYPATRKQHSKPGVVKAPVTTTMSSEVSLRDKYMEDTEDKDGKMTGLTEKHETKENESSANLFQKFKSGNEQTSFEKSQSLRTSQVGSCLLTTVSDLELSTSDVDREDESKSYSSTMGFANKYKHISELVANNLTGYTL